jgi:hypothetical protein
MPCSFSLAAPWLYRRLLAYLYFSADQPMWTRILGRPNSFHSRSQAPGDSKVCFAIFRKTLSSLSYMLSDILRAGIQTYLEVAAHTSQMYSALLEAVKRAPIALKSEGYAVHSWNRLAIFLCEYRIAPADRELYHRIHDLQPSAYSGLQTRRRFHPSKSLSSLDYLADRADL